MKNKTFWSFLLIIASLVGYRLLSDYLEDTRDFR